MKYYISSELANKLIHEELLNGTYNIALGSGVSNIDINSCVKTLREVKDNHNGKIKYMQLCLIYSRFKLLVNFIHIEDGEIDIDNEIELGYAAIQNELAHSNYFIYSTNEKLELLDTFYIAEVEQLTNKLSYTSTDSCAIRNWMNINDYALIPINTTDRNYCGIVWGSNEEYEFSIYMPKLYRSLDEIIQYIKDTGSHIPVNILLMKISKRKDSNNNIWTKLRIVQSLNINDITELYKQA